MEEAEEPGVESAAPQPSNEGSEGEARAQGGPDRGMPHEAELTRSRSSGPGGASDDAGTRGRRLHSLAGALVLGGFLVAHLLTNASALVGESAYDAVVGSIGRSSVLPVLELFVLGPLAFHVGYGVRLLRGKPTSESDSERYGDRRLWLLQRLSAAIVLVFVLGHLWELRAQRLFFGLSPDALHTVLSAHLSWTWGGVPWIALLYLVGIAATAFHFSNGLFAWASTGSVAPEPTSRRRMRTATVALGVGIFLIGAATVVGVATGTCLRPSPNTSPAPCGSAAPIAVPPTPSSH